MHVKFSFYYLMYKNHSFIYTNSSVCIPKWGTPLFELVSTILSNSFLPKKESFYNWIRTKHIEFYWSFYFCLSTCIKNTFGSIPDVIWQLYWDQDPGMSCRYTSGGVYLPLPLYYLVSMGIKQLHLVSPRYRKAVVKFHLMSYLNHIGSSIFSSSLISFSIQSKNQG